MLAFTCLLAGVLAWGNVRATSAMRDAWEERRAGNLVPEALLNAETGQRGYVLTRDPAYLEPYDAAARDFTNALALLRGWSADHAARGQVRMDFAPAGLKWHLVFPTYYLSGR